MDGTGLTPIDALARGIVALRAGRAAEAEAAYRAAFAADPDEPMAAYLLGRLLLSTAGPGDQDEAILLLRHALALRPGDLDTRRALAQACLAAGWHGEAIDLCRAVLSRQPGDVPALLLLAAALLGADEPADALGAAEAALAQAPSRAAGWHAAGVALRALGHYGEAEDALERAVGLDPGLSEAWITRGHVAADRGRLADAEAFQREAVARAPASSAAQASLGAVLTEAGRLPEAIAACDAALALSPDDTPGCAPTRAIAHWHRAIAHLLAGDFAAGWADFEWRKRHPRFAVDFPPLPGEPWDATPLAGRALLVRAEQGLGDTIQFARFLPGLAADGRVVLACHPANFAALAPLLAQLPAELCPLDRAPPTACHADLASLPFLLGVRPATIPGAQGYLLPEPARAARWWSDSAGLTRVGLVWAGNPAHRNDARRSLPPAAVAAILAAAEAAPGLRFESLQKGERAREAGQLYGLADHSPRLTDLAEAAAAISRLDLVITIDSAIAHLAGALGKPVWLLLPFAPDWRWMLKRTDSPWYASIRLFRQSAPGGWAMVAARVAAALITHARRDGRA